MTNFSEISHKYHGFFIFCENIFCSETLIVNEESSFCEFGSSVKIDENHVNVNKPASRGDPAYFELVNFIVSSTDWFETVWSSMIFSVWNTSQNLWCLFNSKLFFCFNINISYFSDAVNSQIVNIFVVES